MALHIHYMGSLPLVVVESDQEVAHVRHKVADLPEDTSYLVQMPYCACEGRLRGPEQKQLLEKRRD
jgi:hypothetical protein